ncbi:DUF3883 domain-containing protein [[Flexibacter] sp. ATCC 35208]|uniref:protein NO VEIN domain-containing protein n=1 Tax=[Flexibacter] sp. ATCC 35208 TaxID=1936242 RepID=UPI0009CE9739|nr:DUF3883 domain-containing protein [[Flexibacter] sp. ATCC 35208]OMP74549.1 hypothetical protein BW716_34775 [[Flexibacter] sp. ATCC 35208]
MEAVTEFVIDLSGSMEDKIGLTKQMLLSDIIPALDYSSKIGIKSFSSVKGLPSIVQELPLSIIDKDAISMAVNKLTVKKGGTPISEAIRQSVATLKEYSSSNKKIILVTDGEEDKGGDYVSECKKAQTDGINCEIHIIGIGLKAQEESKAKEIAKLTNGTYSNIPFTKGTAYSQLSIKSNLSTFYSVISKTVPTQQPISTSKDILPSQAENVKVSGKIEQEPPKSKISENSRETNEILKMLVLEMKSIKQEVRELKAEKKGIPEILEDYELNESIRLISEKYLFEILKAKYPNRVKWLNENGESKLDHDFEILEEGGNVEYFIECKGTAKQKETFFLTKSEWLLFLNNTKNYQIYFIQNSFTSPSAIFINNVLDWLLKGKLLPYLKARDIVKEERVFLTISDSQFIK